MDVLLNQEEEMVVSSAREFFEGECDTDLVRAMEVDPLGYPRELWKKVAEMGWIGMCLPESLGGQDLPRIYLGLVLQEAGRALAPLPLHCSVVAASAVARAGSTELANVFLPPLIRGDSVMTWAFTERDPRFLPDTVQMSARTEGDAFVLNGSKMFVDFFPASDQCLVACRTAAASAHSSADAIALTVSWSAMTPGSPASPATMRTRAARPSRSCPTGRTGRRLRSRRPAASSAATPPAPARGSRPPRPRPARS
jgi:alkylation response protein AidB-like acyl-CoA dehydrogenase